MNKESPYPVQTSSLTEETLKEVGVKWEGPILLRLDEIQTRGVPGIPTQTRLHQRNLNTGQIESILQGFEANHSFDAGIVYRLPDGGYVLLHGFHRHAAALRGSFAMLPCYVVTEVQDGQWESLLGCWNTPREQGVNDDPSSMDQHIERMLTAGRTHVGIQRLTGLSISHVGNVNTRMEKKERLRREGAEDKELLGKRKGGFGLTLVDQFLLSDDSSIYRAGLEFIRKIDPTKDRLKDVLQEARSHGSASDGVAFIEAEIASTLEVRNPRKKEKDLIGEMARDLRRVVKQEEHLPGIKNQWSFLADQDRKQEVKNLSSRALDVLLKIMELS